MNLLPWPRPPPKMTFHQYLHHYHHVNSDHHSEKLQWLHQSPYNQVCSHLRATKQSKLQHLPSQEAQGSLCRLSSLMKKMDDHSHRKEWGLHSIVCTLDKECFKCVGNEFHVVCVLLILVTSSEIKWNKQCSFCCVGKHECRSAVFFILEWIRFKVQVCNCCIAS